MSVVSVDTEPSTGRPTTLPRTLDDVPGWFWPMDQQLFGWMLERQVAAEQTGDLVELGAYLGRSAILMGRHLQSGETFTVCDLFDSDAPDDSNAAEMTMSYRKTLTRTAFESNYLAFHKELPAIVQAPSSVLADGRIPPDSCRFMHIDASHLYEHVAGDIQVARTVLQEKGIVVLDDFRAPHTPGVAAATWEAVFNHGLRPICVTPEKFYGTWGDATQIQDELLLLNGGVEGCHMDEDDLGGLRLVRMSGHGVARLMPPPPSEKTGRTVQPATAASPSRSTARKLALDLMPPLATRLVRRGLQANRDRD